MTTLTLSQSAALTSYLQRATWGLPEVRRQELWDELEEHLLTRAEHLQLTGLSSTQALTQAIRELGSPSRVTLGMAKVYTMPKLLLAAATLALSISAGLYALAGGGGAVFQIPIFEQPRVGQLCVADVPDALVLNLPVLSRRNAKICYQVSNTTNLTSYPSLISVPSARQVMQALGGTVTVRPDGKIELRRPNGTWSRGDFAFDDGTQRYIVASTLFEAVISTRDQGDAITLSGFAQPTLTIGSTVIQLMGKLGDKIGNTIYSSVMGEVIAAVMFNHSDAGFSFQQTSVSPGAPQHQIQTRLPAGEVVALLTQSGKNKFSTDFAPVASDGTVRLRASATRLSFVQNALNLGTVKSGRTPAMLVRMTGVPLNKLKASVFVPTQPLSDAP